jgi:hypothetical protein
VANHENGRYAIFQMAEVAIPHDLLPTLGIKGRFRVFGVGLEPMSALGNSTFDRAGAANGGSPPLTPKYSHCSIGY